MRGAVPAGRLPGAGAQPAAAGAVQGLAAKAAAAAPSAGVDSPLSRVAGRRVGPRLSRGQARRAVGREGASPPREGKEGGQMAGGGQGPRGCGGAEARDPGLGRWAAGRGGEALRSRGWRRREGAGFQVPALPAQPGLAAFARELSLHSCASQRFNRGSAGLWGDSRQCERASDYAAGGVLIISILLCRC